MSFYIFLQEPAMMQRIRILSLVAITATLAACGGGDSGVTPSFAGAYNVNAPMIGNNCSITGLPGSIATTQTVAQADRNITLVSGTTTFTGTVDGDNGGFSTANKQIINAIEFNSTMNYRTSATAGTYGVQYALTGGGCTVTYSGTAIRK